MGFIGLWGGFQGFTVYSRFIVFRVGFILKGVPRGVRGGLGAQFSFVLSSSFWVWGFGDGQLGFYCRCSSAETSGGHSSCNKSKKRTCSDNDKLSQSCEACGPLNPTP